MTSQPWLTVVTVVRNDRAGLAATTASVARQAVSGFEHLVVDGASHDGTTELARGLADESGLMRVVSEPDGGIYDAMNKGWRWARGQAVHFLNAGDVYRTDRELAAVRQRLATTPTPWLRTQVQFVDGSGAPSRPVAPVRISSRTFRWGWQPVAHQGAFMTRSLLADLGGFATQFGIVADFDLMRRALAAGVEPIVWDRVTVAVDDSGVSTKRYVRGFAEMHRSRSVGRSPALQAVSLADAVTHVAVVAGRRGARGAAERALGVQRVRRMRGLSH